MSSKICAKCSRTVYPAEELKCLDKSWHKGCFKCTECNMTLTLKNYQGFEKRPYCSAHTPKAKFTVVAETPEGRRLSTNTHLQSQAKYKEEFNKSIGQCISIANDPETERVRQNSNFMGNAYRDQGNGGDAGAPDYPPTIPVGGGPPRLYGTNVTYQAPAGGNAQPFSYPVMGGGGGARAPSQVTEPPPMQLPPSRTQKLQYKALYDYDAQDKDEVSFQENDIIVECDPVDEGWMYGTVKSTGQRGLLPTNYVEQV